MQIQTQQTQKLAQQQNTTHYYCPNMHPTLYVTTDPPTHCSRCKGELLPIPTRGNNTSNSFFDDVDRCLRYSYFRHELNLRKPHEDKVAMNAGTIWHEIMRSWHSSKGEDITTRITNAKNAGVEEFKNYPDFPLIDRDSSNRSLEHIMLIFDLYVKKYGPNDSLTPIKINGKELSEVDFSLVVAKGDDPENPLLIRGIIDLVGANMVGDDQSEDGSIRVFDYKSTAMMTPAKIASYQTSDQATIYIHAVRELFDIDIKWCLFDVVGFYKNIDISKHYLRPLTSRTRAQCAALMEELPLKWIYYSSARATGIWPKSSSHCMAYNRMCEYAEPCMNWEKPKEMKVRLENSYVVEVRKRKWEEQENENNKKIA